MNEFDSHYKKILHSIYMDTPLKQTILFDNTSKLRGEIDKIRVEFDKFNEAQKEFNLAQDKKNNVILKQFGIDPISLKPLQKH